ncbi:MAG: NAD(P)/FAD-dependent oxidoreductase [Candidatus Omnitrophota bacterium]
MKPLEKNRVFIIGGGFAGIYTAMGLEKFLSQQPSLEVTLISQDNFFLFTPLLHEVVSSSQGGANIANPIRKLFKRVHFIQSRVDHVDFQKKIIFVTNPQGSREEFSYDQLVFALGLAPNFFNILGLPQKALTVKSLSDGIRLRNRMIACLEKASCEQDPEKRRRFLTFIVAGGGFTGVEILGAMDDFLKEALAFYPHVKVSDLRIVLVHSGEVLAPEMHVSLGVYVQKKFEQRHIEIKLKCGVVAIKDDKVLLSSGEAIAAETLVWTAGNTIHHVIEALPIEKKQGRILVNEYLEVPGYPGVWAIGDCAYIFDKSQEKAYPPTAQHAIREAEILADNIRAPMNGQPKKVFSYKSLGQLANIGHFTGVAMILGVPIKGCLAWLLWRDIYLSKLPRLEKKMRVWFNWVMLLFFKRDTIQFLKEKDS